MYAISGLIYYLCTILGLQKIWLASFSGPLQNHSTKCEHFWGAHLHFVRSSHHHTIL